MEFEICGTYTNYSAVWQTIIIELFLPYLEHCVWLGGYKTL